MIIQKKSKNNRGRPKKEFKIKKIREYKKTLQELNKTDESLIKHTIPSCENILNIIKKDKSIFYLFIFSIILFLISITFLFIKKENLENQKKILKNYENIVSTKLQTEKINEKNNKLNDNLSKIENILIQMYETINEKNINKLGKYRDQNIKNSNTIKTYFNTKRLTRFIDNITDKKISISNIIITPINNYSRKVKYTITYTLKNNNTTFVENRESTIIKKNENYQIAAIKCETSGCSKMPFFNPKKYNIK